MKSYLRLCHTGDPGVECCAGQNQPGREGRYHSRTLLTAQCLVQTHWDVGQPAHQQTYWQTDRKQLAHSLDFMTTSEPIKRQSSSRGLGTTSRRLGTHCWGGTCSPRVTAEAHGYCITGAVHQTDFSGNNSKWLSAKNYVILLLCHPLCLSATVVTFDPPCFYDTTACHKRNVGDDSESWR